MSERTELEAIANQAMTAAEAEQDDQKKQQLIQIAEDAVSRIEAMESQATPTEAPAPAEEIQVRSTDVPPTTDMYSGLSPDDAQALYQRYREDPRTRTRQGYENYIPGLADTYLADDGSSYKLLPPTTDIITGGSYVSIPEKLYGGYTNFVRNVAELGASGVDKAVDYIDPENELDATSYIQRNFPKTATGDSIVDTVMTEGVSLGAGILTGTQIISGLSKVKNIQQAGQYLGPYISTAVKGISQLLGAEAGMTAGASSDAGTLFVGDKAMLPVLEGFNIPEDQTEADKVIAQRANILGDAVLLAGPLTAAAKGVAYTAGFVKSAFFDPLRGVVSQNARENALVTSILDRLASVTPASTEAEIRAVQESIVETINKNKETVVEMGERNVDDVVVQHDSMTALQQGLDTTDDTQRLLSAEANTARSGVLTQGGVRTQDATEAPARGLEDVTRRVEGEGEAIQPAVETLQETGQRAVAEADQGVKRAQDAVERAELNIPKVIAEDPTVGAKISQIEDATGINIYAGRDQAADEIVGGVRSAYELMKGRKDELFNAVKGGTLKPVAVLKMFDSMSNEQAEALFRALPNNSPIRGLVSASRRQTVKNDAGKEVLESVAAQKARIEGYLNSNNIDFGYMYREVRPALAEAASILYTAGNAAERAAGKATRDWVRYIDGDLLDWVAKNGGREASAQAKAAKDYYMREYAPFWNDGALGEVADLYDGTIARTSTGMQQEGLEIGTVNFGQGALDTLTGVLTDSQRVRTGQLIDLLDSPNTTLEPSVVTDYIIGDVLGNVSAQVRSKGADALDVDQVVNSLSSYGNIIADRFPQEAERLAGFVTSLRNAKGNVKAQQAILEQAEQTAKATKDKVYNDTLNGFFTKNGVPNPNGYETLQRIINNPQGATQINELMELAAQSGNPLVIEGMQQAYMRNLRTKLLGATRESTGSRALNMGQATRLTDDEAGALLDHGDIIFRETPELMEGVRSLIDLTKGVAIGKRARSFAGASNTAFSQQARGTMDRIVLAVVGPLTRIGARIRSATGTVISRLSPDEAAEKALDVMMADPEEFVRIARRALAEPTIPPEVTKSLFGLMVRTGIYNEQDEMDYLNAAAQAEIELERAANSVQSQMDEVLPQ